MNMDNFPSANATALTLCNACFKNVNEIDAFCNNCGYPLKGSEMEQQTFIVDRGNREADLEEANKKIKRAGNTLFWVAGGTVLMGFVLYFTSSDPDEKVGGLIVNLILAMLYVALGGWSRKKPMAALISGFSLYILILILNAVVSPASIASGIIIKILFIGYFINGIKSAIEAEKIKKELNIE